MEAKTWWLIAVPVLFALGWIGAQYENRNKLRLAKHLPGSYFKGLNHLLNDQPDLAVTAFEEVAKLDPDTAELYFAMGSLFRRRGETERAIRIHRNLLERMDLPETQRQQALFELAQDYLNAGLFDRSELAFSQLEGTAYAAPSQQHLARLYEKEGNWAAAIAALQSLKATKDANTETTLAKVDTDLAHYYCELAQSHLNQSDAASLDQADAALTQATQSDNTNPRITFLQAQLAFARAQDKDALTLLDAALASQPKAVLLAVQTLARVYTARGDAVWPAPAIDRALQWLDAVPSPAAVQLVLVQLASAQRVADAARLLQAVSGNASQTMLGVSLLLQNDYIDAAKTQMQALARQGDKPVCSQCGFKASRHHWRCPGCARWNTLPLH